jgi:formamidopyrimidine-DNA glycosylase
VPELPEVERIVRYLRPRLVGRALDGRPVVDVSRRAKLIIITFDGGDALVIHLKLTGKLWVDGADAPPRRFARRTFDLSDGGRLVMEDARRLGWARVHDAATLARIIDGFGPEPLERGFDLRTFRARLARRRRRRLKPLLLDPAFVAGVGNIYADEALFAARLHPLRTGDSLGDDEVRALHRAIRATLRAGLKEKAGDVPDQERVGAGGRSAAKKLTRLKVFQKDGQACPRCDATIVRTVVQGRGTYLCPACQPATKARRSRVG